VVWEGRSCEASPYPDLTRHSENAASASGRRDLWTAFSVTQLWTVMNTPVGVETPLYVAEMGWSPLPTAGRTTLN
jgi:hypothetical protein